MRRARTGGVIALAATALAGGCAGTSRQIVETRSLSESSSAPEIVEIVDLGGRDVPARGDLAPGGGDGIAVIGEALWVRGSSFGRQPTVEVGGQPAAALARTGDGGVLVRVPPQTPTGVQAVVVANEHGRSERTIPVRRLAGLVPPQGGRVLWADLTQQGVVPIGQLEVADGRAIRMSPDGRAAYVAGDGALTVIELPAANLPAVAGRIELGGGPVRALGVAIRAPFMVVVRGAGDVIRLDLSAPLRPVRSQPQTLPADLRSAGVRAVDLSPDGRWLALATVEENRVVLFDLKAGTGLKPIAQIRVAPDARVPTICDLAFSPSGDAIWVLLGDTAESAATGPQVTRAVALRLHGAADGGTPQLELARTIFIGTGHAPARLATGRHLPYVSGSAIRLPPEKAAVYVTAQTAEEKRWAAFRVGPEDQPTELAAGGGAPGGVDVTPDGRWLLAGGASGDGGIVITAAPADGRAGAVVSVELSSAGRVAGAVPATVTPPAPDAAARATGPSRPADLRVQP